MICTACNEKKHPVAFRMRRRKGAIYRVKQCYDCERERSNDAKRKRLGLANPNGYLADTDLWHLPKQPWPWPPGTKVFEDIKLRRAA